MHSRIRTGPSGKHPSLHLATMLLLAWMTGCGDGALAPIQQGEELPGGDTTNTLLLGANAFTFPAENITVENESSFFSGNSFFNQAWVQAPASTQSRDGLGPLFNARSCAACHFKDGRGSPPVMGESFLGLLLRLSIPGGDENGAPLPHPVYGGQLQPFSLSGVPAEGSPSVTYEEVRGAYADGTPYTLLEPTYRIDSLAYGPLPSDIEISPRVAPSVIGLGLLEAIPLERLMELEDADDSDDDGISGRINWVWDATSEELTVGRFGWKSEQPSVRQQSAGAFNGDLGITTPIFPSQNCTPSQPECMAAINGGTPEFPGELLDRLETYGQLLAVPVRVSYRDRDVRRGKQLFADAGCTGCHVSNHRTAPDANLAEVRDQSIWPYSDLLLHDMGEGLSDNRPSFGAVGAEWRTPPLWGLGFYEVVNGHDRLLHDGRARGVAEAILWHSGEGETAKEAFRTMSAAERDALVEFVRSL